MRLHPRPHLLLEAPPPDTVALGVKIPTQESGGHRHSDRGLGLKYYDNFAGRTLSLRNGRAPLSQRPSGAGGWMVADPYCPCWWFYHRNKGPGLTPAPQDGLPCLPTSAQVNTGAHDSSREPPAHEHPAFVKAHTGVGCQLQSPLSNCDPSSSTPRASEMQTFRPKPDPPEACQTSVSERPLVLQALLV